MYGGYSITEEMAELLGIMTTKRTVFIPKVKDKKSWSVIMKSYGYVVSRKGNVRGLRKRNYSEWVW